MKCMINGEEAELGPHPEGIDVQESSDRLVLRTKSGLRTALVRKVGPKTLVSYQGEVYEIEPATRSRSGPAASSGDLKAPMPGVIVDILVEVGDTVTKGQKIIVLEAMKTQQPFGSPFDGTVKVIAVEKTDQVVEGQLLVSIEKSP